MEGDFSIKKFVVKHTNHLIAAGIGFVIGVLSGVSF